MADLKQVSGKALTQAVEDGYTVIYTWIIVYEDGREVVVPDSRYIDVVEAERHFRQAYDKISDREETISWLIWRRLKRHDNPNEHPKGEFNDWLNTVARPVLKAEIDLEEEPVPLAPQ